MKKIISLFIFIILLSSIEIDKSFSISNNNIIKLDDNPYCPGVSSCCESGYNVMCHMVDPIKNYNVTDVVCGNRGGGVYHKGMDLTKGSGNGNIYASFEGKVIATTNNAKNCTPGNNLVCSPVTCSSSRGISVTIEVTDSKFSGYQIHYMHMSEKYVNTGDYVNQNQLIGKIGNTGCSTGTHLHFQINNYVGDPIYITPYFTDKESYTCGGSTIVEENKPIIEMTTAKSLLKDNKGITYKAKIVNCVGSVSNKFNQGIELMKKNNTDIVFVYAINSGTVVSETTSNCNNGITIFTDTGSFQSYCNLSSNSLVFNLGNAVKAGDKIGEMSNEKLVYIEKVNNKFVDLSSNFLSTYGGTCQNKKRNNCNSIKDAKEKYQCNNIIIK